MHPRDPLRSPWLAVLALVLATTAVAVGLQQVVRRVSDWEPVVLAPLAIALGLSLLVLAAGARAAGVRRTPYW